MRISESSLGPSKASGPKVDWDDVISHPTTQDGLSGELLWRQTPRRTRGFQLLDFLVLHLCRTDEVREDTFERAFEWIGEEAIERSLRRLLEGGLLVPEQSGVEYRVKEQDGVTFKSDTATWEIVPAILDDEVMFRILAGAARRSWERYEKDADEGS